MKCRQTTITLLLLNVPDSSSNSNRMYLLGTGANQLCNIIAEQSYGDRVLAGQIRRNDPPVYDIISLISIFISVHKTNVFTAQWVELARIRMGMLYRNNEDDMGNKLGNGGYITVIAKYIQMSSKCPVLYQERQIEVPRTSTYIYKMTQSMCEYAL